MPMATVLLQMLALDAFSTVELSLRVMLIAMILILKYIRVFIDLVVLLERNYVKPMVASVLVLRELCVNLPLGFVLI